MGRQLRVRVGGSFIWPPTGFESDGGKESLTKVVFVAGGVGINPMMSMMSFIHEQKKDLEIEFLYSVKSTGSKADIEKILFLERLKTIFREMARPGALKLFLTGDVSVKKLEVPEDVAYARKRIAEDDIEEALGSIDMRRGVAVYVCGVPEMTDWVTEYAGTATGMSPSRVFCERWW